MEAGNKLMKCISSLFSVRRREEYSRRMIDVIRCKQAEQSGDYKKAYELLLDIVDKNLYGKHPMSKSHRFTMCYNIPIECLFTIKDTEEQIAVAALYNLYWTGFPTPGGFARVHNNKFTLRVDGKHEYLGELLIISKEEYEDPIKFRPELRSGWEKPTLRSETWVHFHSGELNDMIVKYKTLDRGNFKHKRIYLECEGHYYEYSWQFSLG